MGKLFGTDGVRGKANTELSAELALALGRAAVSVLSQVSSKPLFILGRDTRVSGHLLSAALASGLMSAGAEVWDVGVLPTPALAYLTKTLPATAGVVISASHNPAIDNGIKFFSHDGFKLSDEVEDRIEELVNQPERQLVVAGDAVGTLTHREDLQSVYLDYLVRAASFSGRGLSVVVDCANGAAYQLGPELFRRLGCDVVEIYNSPDGTNINVSCGSTHPELMVSEVIARRADAGFALDGDADRLIACDATGTIVDGDCILAICSTSLKDKGQLANSTVVGTVMSNMGLDALLQRRGIALIRSQVGDKYVLQEMLRSGAILGAEQSGHCIFLNHGTTGDGLLCAAMLMKIMVEDKASLAGLASALTRYPQVLTNVRVRDRSTALESERVKEAIDRAVIYLGNRGRLLVRASGTENVIRVMVEAEELGLAQETVSMVVAYLETHKEEK